MKLKPIKVKPGSWFDAHELAKDYRIVDGPEMWAMGRNMKDHAGFLDAFPVVLRRNAAGDLEVLDGRTRQMACKREGIEPKFVEFIGTDLEALAFVYAANRTRRHLGASDQDDADRKTLGRRALLAGASATATVGKPPSGNSANLHDIPESPEEDTEGRRSDQSANLHFDRRSGNSANLHGIPKSLDEAAEEQGVSRRTAANGKVVVEHGTEALQGAVIDGTVSVSDAAKVAKAPPEVQDKAVEAVRNGKAKSAAAAAREAGDDTEAEARPDPVDAEGEVIPVRALAAFERAKEMDLWCRQVNQLVSRAVEFAKGPGGRCLNAESVKIQLQNAKGTVWANRPTHVCPYCRGEEGKAPCKPCGGEGWVPKHVWVSAPGNNKKGVAAP